MTTLSRIWRRIASGPRPTVGTTRFILMTDLAPTLAAWESMPYPSDDYPPGFDEGEVEGEDLALLAGDVAAVLHCAIRGGWDRLADGDTILDSSIPALEHVLPSLSPTGRAYFEPPLSLLREAKRRRALVIEAESGQLPTG